MIFLPPLFVFQVAATPENRMTHNTVIAPVMDLWRVATQAPLAYDASEVKAKKILNLRPGKNE